MTKKILGLLLSQLVFLLCLPIFLQLSSYLHPIVIFVVWGYVTVFICFALFLVWEQSVTIPKAVLNIGLFLYTICLFILLFFRPNEQAYDNWNLVPFDTILFFLSGNVGFLVVFYNLVANIILFIPFGITLMISIRSHSLRFLIPFLAISSIELLQFFTKRGSLDIDDLILNLIGIYIGYLITPLFLRVVKIK